jgi:hypothetical protein
MHVPNSRDEVQGFIPASQGISATNPRSDSPPQDSIHPVIDRFCAADILINALHESNGTTYQTPKTNCRTPNPIVSPPKTLLHPTPPFRHPHLLHRRLLYHRRRRRHRPRLPRSSLLRPSHHPWSRHHLLQLRNPSGHQHRYPEPLGTRSQRPSKT